MSHPPIPPRRHFLRRTATYAAAGVVPGLATTAGKIVDELLTYANAARGRRR